MSDETPRRNRRRVARERIQRRQQRREQMKSGLSSGFSQIQSVDIPGLSPSSLRKARDLIGDSLWYSLRNASVLRMGIGAIVVVVALFIMGTLLSGNIGPNVWALNVPLGGLSVEDAEAALLDHWYTDMAIDVRLDGETFARVPPADLGLTIDAAAIAQMAKDVGLSGFPFGYQVEPIVGADYTNIQAYMLGIVDAVYIPSYEAGYEWENDQIVGVAGTASRELDIALSVEQVRQSTPMIVATRRFDLLTTSTLPTTIDPSPYLEDAYAFVTSDFTLVGYDPFTNDFERWRSPQEEMAKWLAAGSNGVILREKAFERFVDAINRRLEDPDAPRYVEPSSATESMREALVSNDAEAYIRIGYLPRTYIVESGDSGFRIGRRTGLPFQEIQQVNPGVEWESLFIGQEIALPAWDVVMPQDPVPTQRIVVDLDRLWMVAYENEEMVFNWPISSGRSSAPTYPGVFQILEKVEKAYGSSFNLCNSDGCGQWVMDYFMGIYEVAPNLMNGFHGAVLLPNGQYLNGGSEQVYTTFGCVMSDNTQAELLYNWANVGTTVEIVSSEFAPRSDLALNAMDFITQEIGLQQSYALADAVVEQLPTQFHIDTLTAPISIHNL